MANQKNFEVFTYEDDNGDLWNKRGELDAAVNGIDGSAALTPGEPVWLDTPRRRTRKAVFYDPQTFRTKTITVYTPAAFAAITGATTLAVHLPGNVAPDVYSLSAKIAEKQPVAKTTRKLPDSA